MTRVELQPQLFQVFNELDRQGLLLGLRRVENENNQSYKQRISDVFVNRPNSTYRGLINAINRELGFSLSEAIRVNTVLDIDGNPLYPNCVIKFQDTKCLVYDNYITGSIVLSQDRFNPTNNAYDLEKLIVKINDTGVFTASLMNEISGQQRSMTIFNQSNLFTIPSESLSNHANKISLRNKNILEGTFFLSAPNLFNEVDSDLDIRRPGDYYLDNTNGILYTGSVPSPGSTVRYIYRQDNTTFLSSPVIIHNLQSEDFKSHMYNQVEQDDGSFVNGSPTQLGSDIINGILSVYPSNWGQ